MRAERLAEVDRIADHVTLSLTEILQRTDEEIGHAAQEVDEGVTGAEGRLAQAESPARGSAGPARAAPGGAGAAAGRDLAGSGAAGQRAGPAPSQRAKAWTCGVCVPDPETEMTAMRVVMEHETALGRQVEDVHEKDLGYDVTSLDLRSGELRLIEVKGLKGPTGSIVLTPNERRVAEDRPGLLLALRGDRLRDGPEPSGTDPRSGAVPVARGHQGGALPPQR